MHSVPMPKLLQAWRFSKVTLRYHKPKLGMDIVHDIPKIYQPIVLLVVY